MRMIQVRHIVLPSIFTPPLFYSIMFNVLPDSWQIALFAPVCQSRMPALFLIASKDILFGRMLLILVQILIEFQMEERVALLPVSCD